MGLVFKTRNASGLMGIDSILRAVLDKKWIVDTMSNDDKVYKNHLALLTFSQ
jgi:hypothetical protein